MVVYLGLTTLSPWPPLVTVRHLLAAPNCDAERTVGLAPARRGQPGYWPSHDADSDGIACEPRRPRWR
jgi:Excalibur calcium-binding domain